MQKGFYLFTAGLFLLLSICELWTDLHCGSDTYIKAAHLATFMVREEIGCQAEIRKGFNSSLINKGKLMNYKRVYTDSAFV